MGLVDLDALDTSADVETYKRLSAVERAFRCLKSAELLVRPIFHYRDEAPPARTDPVGPPGRLARAIAKEHAHRTPDGLPVGSFG